MCLQVGRYPNDAPKVLIQTTLEKVLQMLYLYENQSYTILVRSVQVFNPEICLHRKNTIVS